MPLQGDECQKELLRFNESMRYIHRQGNVICWKRTLLKIGKFQCKIIVNKN